MAHIHYISSTYQPPTIAFAVGNQRYEYTLPNELTLSNILYLIRKVSIGKAFAQAKRVGRLTQ